MYTNQASRKDNSVHGSRHTVHLQCLFNEIWPYGGKYQIINDATCAPYGAIQYSFLHYSGSQDELFESSNVFLRLNILHKTYNENELQKILVHCCARRKSGFYY